MMFGMGYLILALAVAPSFSAHAERIDGVSPKFGVVSTPGGQNEVRLRDYVKLYQEFSKTKDARTEKVWRDVLCGDKENLSKVLYMVPSHFTLESLTAFRDVAHQYLKSAAINSDMAFNQITTQFENLSEKQKAALGGIPGINWGRRLLLTCTIAEMLTTSSNKAACTPDGVTLYFKPMQTVCKNLSK